MNQSDVTESSLCSEKSTDVEETYFLLQLIYSTMSQKISVETDVTEDLSTTEDVNKDSNTTAEQ